MFTSLAQTALALTQRLIRTLQFFISVTKIASIIHAAGFQSCLARSQKKKKKSTEQFNNKKKAPQKYPPIYLISELKLSKKKESGNANKNLLKTAQRILPAINSIVMADVTVDLTKMQRNTQ